MAAIFKIQYGIYAYRQMETLFLYSVHSKVSKNVEVCIYLRTLKKILNMEIVNWTMIWLLCFGGRGRETSIFVFKYHTFQYWLLSCKAALVVLYTCGSSKCCTIELY